MPRARGGAGRGRANLFHIALGLNGGIITMSRNYRFDAFTSLLLVINVVANFF